MRSVDRWIQKEISRQDKVVLLEDALLSRRFAAYAWYRLRYFAGRTLVSTLLHGVEFLFLFHIFRERLSEAILVQVSVGFLSSWWWGGLEVLREKVRCLQRDGKMRRVPGTVVSWLLLSGVCAALVVLGGAIWAGLSTWGRGEAFGVFHFYVLASCIRLGVSLLSRTFHSGVYALRRVYRPFLALVGVDFCRLAGTLLCWPLLGRWSFPLLVIVTSFVAAAITFWFVRETYRTLRLFPLPVPRRLRIGRLFRLLLDRRGLLAGSSYALMRLDALLVFVLYGHGTDSGGAAAAFLAVYLMSPLIRAACDWAQLFYFDFKRLELDLVVNFRRAFGNLVSRLSWVVGGVGFLLASVYVTLVLAEPLGFLYLPLGIFFVIRSRLAFFQVRAFAERRYVPLLISGLFLLVGSLLIGSLVGGSVEERILPGVLVLLLGLVYLATSRLGESGTLEPPEVTSAPEWVSCVQSVQGPLKIRALQLCRRAGPRIADELARRVSRRIRGDGRVTLLGRKRVVWYERINGGTPVPDDWLLRMAAGLAESVEATSYEAAGAGALSGSPLWRRLDEPLDGEPVPADEDALRRRFLESFPEGIAYAPGTEPSGRLEELSSAERHEILYAAIQYSRNPLVPPRSRSFEVTTLCAGGVIRMVFAVRRSEEKERRAAWRACLNRVNLRADGGFLSTAGARTGRP